MSVQLNFESGN